MHFFSIIQIKSNESTESCLLLKWIQVKEGETDPLINAEKGTGDGVAKAPAWNSNKDLHA